VRIRWSGRGGWCRWKCGTRKGGSRIPSAEIAAAARDYFAYCGTYELRGGEVVHRVEQSLFPNWIGAEQVRLVALDANRVILSTPPTPLGGRQQIATLVWERT